MSKKLKSFIRNRRLVVSGLALVALAVGLWLIFKPGPASQTIPVKTSPKEASSQELTSNGPNSNKQTAPAQGFSGSGDKSGSGGSSSSNLIAPNGNFVSNHSPGAGGSPTVEQSVCNTTPGASCYIKFTKGNETRSLPAQTADSNGAVIWQSWDVRDANFSDGDWQITAIASLNGQTKTSTDQIPLKVAL